MEGREEELCAQKAQAAETTLKPMETEWTPSPFKSQGVKPALLISVQAPTAQ